MSVVSFADRNGITIARNQPAANARDISAEQYFTFHRDNPGDRLYISQVMPDAVNPNPHLHFTRRISDTQGNFAGVVVLEVDPAYFASGYEHACHGQHGLLGLVGEDDVFRVQRSGDNVSWGQRPPQIGEGDVLAPGSADRVMRFLNVRKMDGFPLYAVGGLSYDEKWPRSIKSVAATCSRRGTPARASW